MAAAAIHPRTPVIIGVAQINGKGRELPSAEPLVTWQAVAQQAVRDAGLNADVLSALNAVLLSDCMTWRYDDPPRGPAERLGASPAYLKPGKPSGTSGQSLVNLMREQLLFRRAAGEYNIRPYGQWQSRRDGDHTFACADNTMLLHALGHELAEAGAL